MLRTMIFCACSGKKAGYSECYQRQVDGYDSQHDIEVLHMFHDFFYFKSTTSPAKSSESLVRKGHYKMPRIYQMSNKVKNSTSPLNCIPIARKPKNPHFR